MARARRVPRTCELGPGSHGRHTGGRRALHRQPRKARGRARPCSMELPQVREATTAGPCRGGAVARQARTWWSSMASLRRRPATRAVIPSNLANRTSAPHYALACSYVKHNTATHIKCSTLGPDIVTPAQTTATPKHIVVGTVPTNCSTMDFTPFMECVQQ
jgi:hypothetical protein